MKTEIPWTQLGIIGSLAVILLIVVLVFLLRWKGNNRGGQGACVNSPEVKEALINNVLMGKNMERMEEHLEKLKENSTGHLNTLKQILSVQKEQTKCLKEIVKNGKK